MNSKYSKHHQLNYLRIENIDPIQHWQTKILFNLRHEFVKMPFNFDVSMYTSAVPTWCPSPWVQCNWKQKKQYFPMLLWYLILLYFTSIRMHKDPVASYTKELKDPFDEEQRRPHIDRDSIWGFCATDALLSVLIGIFILWNNVSLSTFVEIATPNKRIKRNIFWLIE